MIDEHCGLVTCAIIQERLSLENLRTQFTSPYHFIWNKNVHNLPRGLCGMLRREKHGHCKGTGKFRIRDVSIPQTWEQRGL